MNNRIENNLVLFGNKDKSGLDPNQILIAEFNYAAQTAFQANEDRVRVFSYIIANISTFVAAAILPNLNTGINENIFGAIFILLTIVGVLALFQLSRLRVAWMDSVRAMNKIKDFYLANFKKENLELAFHWRTSSIPSANKLNSLAFLLAMTVIFLNSSSLSTAVYIFGNNIVLAAFIGISVMLAQLYVWLKLLR